MPRIAEDSRSLAADLADRLARLVAAAKQEGRDQALAEVRSLIAGNEGGSGPGDRSPVAKKRGRPFGSKNRPKTDAPAKPTKSGKGRKNPWAALSPAERLARVNAIRKGRGLPPKSE